VSLFLLAMLPLAGASPVLTLDFSVDDGGMVATNGLQWEWSEIIGGPADEGTIGTAWATRADGDYLNDASDTIGLPSIDLSAVDRPILALEHWFAIDESGSGDAGWLEVWNGAGYSVLDPIYGYPEAQGFAGSSDFRTDFFDLSGVDDSAFVRLVFSADASVTRHGWVITGISIEDGDPVPPTIEEISTPEDTQNVSGPYEVKVRVLDDFAEPEVRLWWFANAGSSENILMEDQGEGIHSGDIPGADPGTTITWWVTASDGTNTTSWPEDGKDQFEVFLAAPTKLKVPEARSGGRVTALEVTLQWKAPDSHHSLLHSVLLRDNVEVGTAIGESGIIFLEDSTHQLSVAGVFDTPAGVFRGEEATALELHVAVPATTRLSPAHGFQGDTLRIHVQGVHLLMSQDHAALDLGPGIETTGMVLHDADSATFTVAIQEDAATTSRDAILQTGDIPVPVPGGFEIRDGEDRPRLLSISPKVMKQGASETIKITANTPIGADPIVDLGPGIFVQSVAVDGDVLRVAVASATNTPVGPHTITVDDGTRILDGARLQVRDAKPKPQKVCGTISTRPESSIWVLLAVVGLAGIRRRKKT